jgi:TonB family protein
VRNTDKSKKILKYAAILSLFVHVFMMPTKISEIFSSKSISEAAKKPKRVKLVLRKPKAKDKKLKQIVATEKHRTAKEVNAEFLSKSNNIADRQTKAKKVDSFKEAGKGNANKTLVAQSKKPVKKKKKTVAKKGKKKVSFKDFAFTKPIKKEQQQQAIEGIKHGKASKRGLAANNDYLEEVPLGDMTKLNTKEYKYYGFYYRIKQRLEQHWGRTLQQKIEKIYRREGRFPASDKHITSVRVDMDDKGNILNIHIKGSSGVSELDEAAVESFNSAGPFPNPPRGMIKNGRASIEWGFAVTRS